ncbi:hypothetical protein [Pediococcus argentinicus]|uniref:YtxH domain-containing protein n=1 Tax=Pediococcus argentinicus TaxID=480391 RepID=A0A0R2NHI9_9LACO|nr:hypothetical protein [Pediococcus argentinicus]KRO25257.1 hypothetical protein IV88_GL000293 [Pediococcus argentinicus]NKZ22324.1 hypothetical protein [Pediococcus argentinicus]GEP19453.1 hypothetical protein LSA03_08370 [Pediococcus argentinicus]
MSKASFLFGVVIGGAAAVAATLKLTNVSPEELRDAAIDKFDEIKEDHDFNTDEWRDRASSSVSDLKQRGIDLANRANSKFNVDDDLGDQEDDITIDKSSDNYQAPTEVFMPKNDK